MARDEKNRSRIPIRFPDSEEKGQSMNQGTRASVAGKGVVDENAPARAEAEPDPAPAAELATEENDLRHASAPGGIQPQDLEAGGPVVAELVATRGELKRVESEIAELRDRLARRQADFEN